jgi:hypothetical protein
MRTCPLCNARKAKRSCPALGYAICPTCCGTKREVAIACPSSCVYLSSAAQHPAAPVRRRQEHDVEILLRSLGPLTEPQLQIYFVLQTSILRARLPGGAPGDADVAEAAGAVARSLELAGRGLIYEERAVSPAAETLRRELGELVRSLAHGSTAVERDAAVVLRAIERAAGHREEDIGPGPRAYLSLAARVLGQPAPGQEPPLIVLP